MSFCHWATVYSHPLYGARCCGSFWTLNATGKPTLLALSASITLVTNATKYPSAHGCKYPVTPLDDPRIEPFVFHKAGGLQTASTYDWTPCAFA